MALNTFSTPDSIVPSLERRGYAHKSSGLC